MLLITIKLCLKEGMKCTVQGKLDGRLGSSKVLVPIEHRTWTVVVPTCTLGAAESKFWIGASFARWILLALESTMPVPWVLHCVVGGLQDTGRGKNKSLIPLFTLLASPHHQNLLVHTDGRRAEFLASSKQLSGLCHNSILQLGHNFSREPPPVVVTQLQENNTETASSTNCWVVAEAADFRQIFLIVSAISVLLVAKMVRLATKSSRKNFSFVAAAAMLSK